MNLSNLDFRKLVTAGRVLLNAALLIGVLIVGLFAVAGWQGMQAAQQQAASAAPPAPPPAVDPVAAFAARCAVESFTVTDRVNAPTAACAAAERVTVSSSPLRVEYAAPLDVDDVGNGRHRVLVHLLAVTGGVNRWLCAAVPVYANNGGYALEAAPSLVACPPVADVPPRSAGMSDREATRNATPTLESFMEAYVEGRAEVVNAMSTVDVEPIDAGLDYVGLDDPRVVPVEGTDGEYIADVAVRVRLPDSTAEFTVRYRTGLAVTGDGWVVTSVR